MAKYILVFNNKILIESFIDVSKLQGLYVVHIYRQLSVQVLVLDKYKHVIT